MHRFGIYGGFRIKVIKFYFASLFAHYVLLMSQNILLIFLACTCMLAMLDAT